MVTKPSHTNDFYEANGHWLGRDAGVWCAFHYDNESGAVCRSSLGVRKFDVAKQILEKHILAIPERTRPKTSLAELLSVYFEEISDRKPSHEQARIAGSLVLEFWGQTATTADISPAKQTEFAQWCRVRGHSVSYIARNLRTLSAALHLAMGDKAPHLITSVDTIAAKLDVPVPGPREWIPTDAELARFLDRLSGPQGAHVFLYCVLALNTLARPAAILDLSFEQIDFQRGLIDLNRAGRRQTKKRRPVVRIPATLTPWMQSAFYEAGQPLIRHRGRPLRSVRRTFTRQGATAGIPELTPYALRHKMATELRARGISLEELAYQLGHRMPNMSTTERYTKFDSRYLARATAAIEDYIRNLNRLTTCDLLCPSEARTVVAAH